ncbi:class I SAM-dependent methyltransferase [Candidatus Microgenomates bacterium]|nr:class I SAM-dependent methyltransferase [Candidatus Microgenomates bacterium]
MNDIKTKNKPLTNFLYSKKRYVYKPSYYLNKAEQERIKIVLKLIGHNKKVLDIACYDGYVGKKIKNNNNIVFGVDASEEAIRMSTKKGLITKVSDIEMGLPYKNNFFNLAFAGEIIEHIVDTDFFIEEIKRVLKKNGELVITTPNIASLDRRFMLLFNINPFLPASFDFPSNALSGHIRFFNNKLLKSFLQHKGFKIVSIESDVWSLPKEVYSRLLAQLFPSMGFSIIIKCRL